MYHSNSHFDYLQNLRNLKFENGLFFLIFNNENTKESVITKMNLLVVVF